MSNEMRAEEVLRDTLHAVAAQVPNDAPPERAFGALEPRGSRHPKRRILIAAAVAVVVVGSVAAFLMQDGTTNDSVKIQPGQATPESSGSHPVPEGTDSISEIALVSPPAGQPSEFRRTYGGTENGTTVKLVVAATNYGRPVTPPDMGCRTIDNSMTTVDGHDACLTKYIAGADEGMVLQWDGGNQTVVSLRATGMSEERVRQFASTVVVASQGLAVSLVPEPAELALQSAGELSSSESVIVSFSDGECRYSMQSRSAGSLTADYLPGSVPITVNGNPGARIGHEAIDWIENDTLVSLSALSHAPELQCDVEAVATSIQYLNDGDWNRLLEEAGTKVTRR